MRSAAHLLTTKFHPDCFALGYKYDIQRDDWVNNDGDVAKGEVLVGIQAELKRQALADQLDVIERACVLLDPLNDSFRAQVLALLNTRYAK